MQTMTQENYSAPSTDASDIAKNKDVAAFAYVWIIAFIVFFARRKSKFAQYHSRQGIVLFLLTSIVWWIPFVGHFLALVAIAGMVLGFMNAAQGKYADVPLVGQFAKGEISIRDAGVLIAHAMQKIFRSFLEYLNKNEHAKDREKEASPTDPASNDHRIDNQPPNTVP